MATWYLLNTTKYKGPAGDTLLDGGKLIDDTKYNLPLIIAAGGSVVPSGDAAATKAAAIAAVRGRQGQSVELIDTLMLAAVLSEVQQGQFNRLRSTNAAGNTVAAAAAISPNIAFTPTFSGKVLVRVWASFAANAGTVKPLVKQGATTVAALAISVATDGPVNYYAEVEVTGLALGTAVTFSFVTTAGDAVMTLGNGATGIAASMEVAERP